MPKYANDVHFIQPNNEWAMKCMAVDRIVDDGPNINIGDRDAERMRTFLEAAFEAGREDMKRELRKLLGVRD